MARRNSPRWRCRRRARSRSSRREGSRARRTLRGSKYASCCWASSPPLAAPPLAVFACAWTAVSPDGVALPVPATLLWLTFLTGFVGLGMHLRGMGRQMGGLYLALFNWLEGPPAFAPALFAGLAAVG